MGAKDSKRACLSYEEAVKRISDSELKRICDAFKRLSNGTQLMSQSAFTQHVLGDGVPLPVAGWLYTACGGSQRGIALRDLICGLVLLTKGTYEEKIKFLWSLYCNDSNTHIFKSDFQRALQLESSGTGIINSSQSLFASHNDKASYDEFRAWIGHNTSSTILSRWLLTEQSVSLASNELDTPTFYQTLAGVTHLEERDICDLEKCFWLLQAGSASGQLDVECLGALVSPPVPVGVCHGLFHALDVNRDGHVDFKELCCGVSAACRGPIAERVKFCFKMFDLDSDGRLNTSELNHMIEMLSFVARQNAEAPCMSHEEVLNSLELHLSKNDSDTYLGQEEFVIWGTPQFSIVHPFLELLFQVCHVSLGLRPRCKHHERDIVVGWLDREEKRGYKVGQFWYLVSSDWWRCWLSYTSQMETVAPCYGCGAKLSPPIEEGVVCDESFTSNSSESMGDLIRGAETASIGSSSGVSSSSGGRIFLGPPGPIDNTNLVTDSHLKVQTLTGEGGRLKKDRTLVQHRDFELIPDSLWKALAHWYGGPLPLPRQVIQPPGSLQVDLELYPLNLRILRHQINNGAPTTVSSWGGVVGGYGAAALSSAGLATAQSVSPRRYLAHTAAFSRLATVGQVLEFLSQRLSLRSDDLRLWHLRDSSVVGPAAGASPHGSPSHSAVAPLRLLDDERATLLDVGVVDGDQILLEVRNSDLTWPEELGALVAGAKQQDRAPEGTQLPIGATGLHNLGNTCFMNAALQAVSNTKPLTMYFRRDIRLSELNQSNPLGTRGQVARRYADLLQQLWGSSARSVAPLKLRWCVARHAPHLGGGGQHDSQELLAWLLDALHEDLNRVTGKRYTELSDSAGRPDVIVAQEAWKQHLQRDHSVITDLFYGQLKSKVTCQTCGHESVRFDPFNVLSLPLPMDSFTLCEVLVVRRDGSVPVKYGVRLNSDARYRDLKERLEKLSEVPAKRLALVEVADSQIRQVLSEQKRVIASSALELLAYELEENVDESSGCCAPHAGDNQVVPSPPESPRPTRSPEVSSSVLCMPSILCFKNNIHMRRSIDQPLSPIALHRLSSGGPITSSVVPLAPKGPQNRALQYITAVHRKCVRQDTYFVTQHKMRSVLFGVPLLFAVGPCSTTQSLYEAVWTQVTRLLSPVPQSDQTNHATDCDDSLGYEFPFTLRTVMSSGQSCFLCPWTKFCRGCALSCDGTPLVDIYSEATNALGVATSPGGVMRTVAIDWEPTALHLRYQSARERSFVEDQSVALCRKQHTEPVDLDHCLKAFTSEESLETRYHCSKCEEKQPATKKLQIWRLPPILIIHLKRFDFVNGKWVKTHKVVNFPFSDFDPTAYLASVPQETILRARALSGLSNSDVPDEIEGPTFPKPRRDRLESTSLLKTPVLDENLQDFHMHHLKENENAFELKYQLYAVVSHSGMLNGGHYISYACNPNGSWYCYNDSSCREVTPRHTTGLTSLPCMDTSSAYMLFYERSGLDYTPYLPEVMPSLAGSTPPPDIDEDDSEMRKQLCSVQ